MKEVYLTIQNHSHKSSVLTENKPLRITQERPDIHLQCFFVQCHRLLRCARFCVRGKNQIAEVRKGGSSQSARHVDGR